MIDLVAGLIVNIVHPLPPDPTLTVDNVTRVMKKIEPEKREEVWESVLATGTVSKNILEHYSPEERESASVDIYVNCCPESSWEDLANKLYHLHQIRAVEEVRSYLPPRGES